MVMMDKLVFKLKQQNQVNHMIHHPIEVAKIVAKDIGLDYISIASALLHDVVEDTDVTFKDLEN